MPITQSRMLSLIAAAQDYEQAALAICERIQQYSISAERGRITAEEALQMLTIEGRIQILLNYPMESPGVIKAEATHFKREGRRNERKASNARENRQYAAAGLPKPNRGDGRQDIYHQTRTKQTTPIPAPNSELNSPTPRVLPNRPPETWAQKAEAARKAAGIEDITADSDLDFGAEISQETKNSVADFLSRLPEDSK